MIAAVLAVTSSARASSREEPPADAADTGPAPVGVRSRYAGATFAGQAGAGIDGFSIVTVGGDAFLGVRLSRWVSFEGFFAYHFATRPSTEIGGGGMCLGSGTDTWHWQVLGSRLWIHLAHLRWLDVSIAPTLAAGISVDHWRSTSPPPTDQRFSCYHPPDVSAGWAFDVGLDFGVEVRPLPWLGVRAMFETSLDGGETNHDDAFGAVSIGGWVGPVLRF